MLFQGNTTGAFLAYLDQNLHYPVFSSPKEVLTLIARLQRKGYLNDLEVTEFARKELEPCRVKNAFILAAGGSDVSAKSVYSMPKGLYKKNGETLIERQIRQLQEAGIERIYVVVLSLIHISLLLLVHPRSHDFFRVRGFSFFRR